MSNKTVYSSESITSEEEEEYPEKEVDDSDDYKVSMVPLCLPVDRTFESKYLYAYLAKNIVGRKPTKQEKIYMFLEHPSGWLGFTYHILV